MHKIAKTLVKRIDSLPMCASPVKGVMVGSGSGVTVDCDVVLEISPLGGASGKGEVEFGGDVLVAIVEILLEETPVV